MILDPFAVPFAISIVAIVIVCAAASQAVMAEGKARETAESLRDLSIREAEGYLMDARRWREAYEARDAQLAEARTRIDTLEGELTAADIALSQARKNDHRDAKGRFARAA